MARAALFCNDAQGKLGSPTELALLGFATKMGLSEELRTKSKRLDELPFDSKTKFMLTLNQEGQELMIYSKGAPEKILKMCNRYQHDGRPVKLTEKIKRAVTHQLEQHSGTGMRVLALSYAPTKQKNALLSPKNQIFLGLVAMMDPPRSKVLAAMEQCQLAGVRVIMVTGDHHLTAKSIAAQVGISSERVVTGDELDGMSSAEFKQTVKKFNIFARVSPAHKLQILRSLQQAGDLVAMTGDGVNDAPALKKAHIGIAVGSGSDLAKEVADMIILDNDFSSIVEAIREGRGIFFNIKKFVKFLIAVNFDEIFLIALSIFMGLPLPLLPIHLLWLNLVTDSLPALALATDPYDRDIMKTKPYNPSQEIKHGIMKFSIFAGFLALIASMSAFMIELFVLQMPLALAQTVTFTVTVFFELAIVFAVRSNRRLRESRPLANKWLLAAVGLTIILQLAAIYLPPAQLFLKTSAIPLNHWPLILALSIMGLVLYELVKFTQKKSPRI